MHREVGGSGYGVDGKEDGEQDEEGVTADRADEILKKLPHYRTRNSLRSNEFFFNLIFQLPTVPTADSEILIKAAVYQ